jgi:hypothetical protein
MTATIRPFTPLVIFGGFEGLLAVAVAAAASFIVFEVWNDLI